MTELIHAGWDGFLFDTLMWTGALIALVLLLRRPVARHFGADAPALVCEPGRAMVAEAFTLGLRVKAIRESGAVFLNDGVYGGLTEIRDIGAPDRLNYTVMGDAVNLAAALERRCVASGDAATASGGDAVPPTRVFVLADTTFGSCCVDEVAAAHAGASGDWRSTTRSCGLLSRPKSGRRRGTRLNLFVVTRGRHRYHPCGRP